MSSIKVRVIFFAKSRDLTGLKEAELELDESGITGTQLLELIVQRYTKLKDIQTTLNLALNENYVSMSDTYNLKENDELAVIPPLSGG